MRYRRAVTVSAPYLFCAVLLGARHTPPRLETAHLEAVHQARLEFIRKRADLLQLGVYRDFRAAWYPGGGDRERVQHAAFAEGVQVLLSPDAQAHMQKGVLWIPATAGPRFPEPTADAETAGFEQGALDNGKGTKKLAALWDAYPQEFYAEAADAWPEFFARWVSLHPKTSFDPYEVNLRHASLHILARDFTAAEIRASLRDGHTYTAHQWLCDPTGFTFVAVNNLGVFDIGDRAPAAGRTRFEVRLPVAAKIKLLAGDKEVDETTGLEATFTARETGDYRLEAWLPAGGEDRLWIRTGTVHLVPPEAMERLPVAAPAGVKTVRDLTYASGKPEDANKHKLDLYLPQGTKPFPVILFVHGGAWRSGDRSLYGALGNRFAGAGIGVAIPSYRLAPANPPSAQIEDVAAAFAWVAKHIAEHGGDPSRIYVAGHSAGGHLAALLALDGKYLQAYGLSPANIKGVAAISGVYDVRSMPLFGKDEISRREFSPLFHVSASAPPFLVAYCQWDYPALPLQAREFFRSLQKAFTDARMVYLPGENHISEIATVWKPDSPAAKAILQFVH